MRRPFNFNAKIFVLKVIRKCYAILFIDKIGSRLDGIDGYFDYLLDIVSFKKKKVGY
uniref:Uncharacterized protein n=1 Tax=uncultured organism TaxID=155900 RepID=Q0GNL7_9ZZZZ|nr:hypothetical protein [uncultured organism]